MILTFGPRGPQLHDYIYTCQSTNGTCATHGRSNQGKGCHEEEKRATKIGRMRAFVWRRKRSDYLARQSNSTPSFCVFWDWFGRAAGGVFFLQANVERLVEKSYWHGLLALGLPLAKVSVLGRPGTMAQKSKQLACQMAAVPRDSVSGASGTTWRIRYRVNCKVLRTLVIAKERAPTSHFDVETKIVPAIETSP